jgi:hypothetical protein
MTNHDAPASLTAVWQRWQEIEKLPDHDDKINAELNAIEEQIIERPADKPADLKVKLKFLFDLARDYDWNDRIEKLYRSIEDGLEKSWCTGYRVVCDVDADLSLIENMSRALQVFTIAEDVWNDERDASAAQALLFKLDDGCKNVREAMSKLGDLLYPWDSVRDQADLFARCRKIERLQQAAAAAEVEGGSA